MEAPGALVAALLKNERNVLSDGATSGKVIRIWWEVLMVEKKKVRSLFNNIFNNFESFRFKSVDGCVGQMVQIVMRIFLFFLFFFLKFEVNEVKTKLRPAIRTLSTGWKSSLRLMIGSLWLSFNLGLQLSSSPRFYIPKDNGTWLLSPRVHGGSTEEERTKSSFERSAIVRLERKRKCSSTFFSLSPFWISCVLKKG